MWLGEYKTLSFVNDHRFRILHITLQRRVLVNSTSIINILAMNYEHVGRQELQTTI